MCLICRRLLDRRLRLRGSKPEWNENADGSPDKRTFKGRLHDCLPCETVAAPSPFDCILADRRSCVQPVRPGPTDRPQGRRISEDRSDDDGKQLRQLPQQEPLAVRSLSLNASTAAASAAFCACAA